MTAIPHPTIPMTQYVSLGGKVVKGFDEGIHKLTENEIPKTEEQTKEPEIEN